MRTICLISTLLLLGAVGCDDEDLDDDVAADDDTAGDDDTAADDDTAGDDDIAGDDDDTSDPLDRVLPSANPPGGLDVEEVPMFVSIGFDDNYYSGLPGSGDAGGMTWALDMLRDRINPDGSPARVSFYQYTEAAEGSSWIRHAWHTAWEDGHEIANHTHTHPEGDYFGVGLWLYEMETCNDWLSKPYDPAETEPDPGYGVGVPLEEIEGFRAPYLLYNNASFDALWQLGMLYDCSIYEGHQWDQDGTNFLWPYTLDEGSPGHDDLVDQGLADPIDDYPGLWELPLHPVIVPPDDACEAYGVEPGLRDRLQAVQPWFDTTDGKILGMDYNLWIAYEMTADEFEATLIYSFDLRMDGNRAPMLFGGHTPEYADLYTAAPNATMEERQGAVEAFLDHALSHPEVRVVPMRDVIDWMRAPQPL